MKSIILYAPSPMRTQELFRITHGGGQVPIWWRDKNEVWYAGGNCVTLPEKAIVLFDPTDHEAGILGCVRMSIVFGLSCIESSYPYWVENPQDGKIICVDAKGNEIEKTA